MTPQSCFAPNEKRKKKLGPAQIHCRNCLYDGTGPERAYVSLNKLPWSRPYLEYMPVQVGFNRNYDRNYDYNMSTCL